MSTVFKGIAKTKAEAKKVIRDEINFAKRRASASPICPAARGIVFYPTLIDCKCGINGGIRGEYTSPGGKKYVGVAAICRSCAK